jgi:pyruvate dehydrogenase E1 component
VEGLRGEEHALTIAAPNEAKSPGDAALEWRIRSIIRWNAMATVVPANRKPGDLGGHIASFASGATLYDVGFNHFWRAPSAEHPGDLLYIQGHSSPGIYARSFLEGRISESQLDHFRMEVDGRGVSSYPHPWLMPDYWQVPTVSMGLGPLAAIYQARNWKYLEGRGLMPKTDRKVWAFLGDGETDEPESLGAISVAGREGLLGGRLHLGRLGVEADIVLQPAREPVEAIERGAAAFAQSAGEVADRRAGRG